MTGLIPAYIKHAYKKEPVFSNAKVVYTIGQNTVPVTIASNQTLGGYYDWFKGNMGIIQIYNRALSASEVLQNFNATRTRFGV
jgi:hypothetical protein